ncbi:MAG: glycoside hydrolase family 127 protein [Clostridiales bacterium]|nr:glycoside hydrolase family 127 protein [Clostridiales bacterium]
MEKHTFIPFSQVKITDGFWKMRQELNADTTIYAVKKRFEETGRFSAYQGHWREGMPHKPYFLLTGDIEKWMESVAYLLKNGKCKELEAVCDEVIDLIERNQFPDGYFNMWLMQTDPTRRWTNRDWHELYAIGHLIEAAVAYYEATGKDKLLRCACKAADHVEKVFVEEKSCAFFTPGHEEIELALVKLYHCTGNEKYLALSRHFINERGMHGEERIPADYGRFVSQNGRYDQTHAPVREQDTAEGHAVRALYLYSGMADLAREDEDQGLLKACQKIFDNIMNCRMYISGGVGSTYRGEAFTIDYDLPNLTAYTESCAAIALMLFARRMLLVDPDSKYADVIEKVLYNGFLSSTSLKGDAFFYENPLEIDPKQTGKEKFAVESARMPIMERAKVFYTSCCPPNITRTMASIGDYLYTCSADTLYIHQFMNSDAVIPMEKGDVKVRQCTDYPLTGDIRIAVEGDVKVAVRIPGWCEKWSLTVDGKPAVYTMNRGYAVLENIQGEICLQLDMAPYAVEANPYVQDDAGRIAICRGPVVYCLEGVDNGFNLRDIHVNMDQGIEVGGTDFCGIPVLEAKGWQRDEQAFGNSLYRRMKDNRKDISLHFVPYFAFANRGVTEMVIWVMP